MVYKSFFIIYYFIKKVDCNIIYGHILLNNINKMEEVIRRYNKCIYDELNKYINSGKEIKDFDNNDLAKIFEYYSCIKLSQEYNQIFYEYSEIDPDFKEEHMMTINDSGIDACKIIIFSFQNTFLKLI